MLTAEQRQMSFAAVCVAILVAVAFYAATAGQSSQRPPPSLCIGIQQEQRHPSPSDQQAGDSPSSGDAALFTVKVIRGKQSADQRAEDAKDHDEKAFNEAWLTRGTVIIAVFTAILAFVAGVQAWFFWHQLGIMKKGIEDNAEIIKLSRAEFIATHRPRIIVRFVQGPFDDGIEPEFVWVTITNAGETPGTITAIRSDLARRIGRNGWLSGLAADAREIPPTTLESRERFVFKASAHAVTSDETIFASAGLDGSELCAVGQVHYHDGNGRKMEMAFLRIHDGDGNFTPSDNPEDEYQD